MGVFRNFPYSNFHEMNMDEIIKIVKNMLEEWAQYYAEWDAWKNQLNDDWSNYQEVMNEAWQNMQDFINNYFDNLDVQNEINNKITDMVNSGEFVSIIAPYISPQVTEWLAEHITQPSGVVIDTSLTVSGACADAKATGDAIFILSKTSEINFTNGKYYQNITSEQIDLSDPVTSSTGYACAKIACEEGDAFIVSGHSGGTNPYGWAFTDSTGIILLSLGLNHAIATDAFIVAPGGASYLVINRLEQHPSFKYNLKPSCVTPEMFGAVGNGIADDTRALQMSAKASADVCLKNTYHITNSVQFDNTTLFGGGTIKMSPNNEDTLISRLVLNNCTVNGINFESSNDYPSVWLDDGLYSNVYILTKNTRFMGCSFIALEDIRSQDADYIVVDNCIFTDCANGVLGTNSKSNYISNCKFDILNYGGEYAHSIYLGGACNYNFISNCEFFGCKSYPIHTYNSSELANGKVTNIENCIIRDSVNAIASNTEKTFIKGCDIECSILAFFLNYDSVIAECIVNCERFLLCVRTNTNIHVSDCVSYLSRFTADIGTHNMYLNGNKWFQQGEQVNFISYNDKWPNIRMQNELFEGWNSPSALINLSRGTLKMYYCNIGESNLPVWARSTDCKAYLIGNVYNSSALAVGTIAVNQNNVSIYNL